jgi:glycine cleavage system H protein
MNIDPNARYTETHEWARKEGDLMAYGITDHAQEALSDLVYIELPAVGDKFSKGDTIGAVESVKAASDLYIPMDGEIVEVNEALVAAPEVINKDPYGEGWMVKFKPSNPADWDSLLTPEAYAQLPGE